MTRLRRALSAVLATATFGVLLSAPSTPAAAPAGVSSPNMSHIANLRWRGGKAAQAGTDLEFATIGGREYAFAGSYGWGLNIIDITNPWKPLKVGTYECNIAQGDVQVFRQGKRTLATYTSDPGYGSVGGPGCYRGMTGAIPAGRYGTFLVDVSTPSAPKPLSYLPIDRGSHNMTVHPSGQWLYNSDADLPGKGQIEVWDIRKPEKPRWTTTLELGPESQTGVHDISFSADGKRAYAAALTESFVLNTAYAGAPSVIARIFDPAVNIHHQAEPVTMVGPGGVEQTFLVLTDELVGGSENVFCPGGGLHVYNITGPLENVPVKVGVFEIPEVRTDPYKARCTSHVLRMHPKEGIMTIAWYAAGARVIDIKNLVGVSAGVDPAAGSLGAGMRELGYYEFADSETWSAKTNKIAADGSFYLFANDHTRGFDVFRYTPPKPPLVGAASVDPRNPPGRWLTPQQALAEARARGAQPLGGYNRPVCMLLPIPSG